MTTQQTISLASLSGNHSFIPLNSDLGNEGDAGESSGCDNAPEELQPKPPIFLTSVVGDEVGATVCNTHLSCSSEPGVTNVQESFRQYVRIDVPSQDTSFPKMKFGYADFLLPITDKIITDVLPGGYIFHDHLRFIALLDALTNQQRGGTAGALLHDGRATFAHVNVKDMIVVARIVWHSKAKEWRYFAAPYGEVCTYSAGRRIIVDVTQ